MNALAARVFFAILALVVVVLAFVGSRGQEAVAPALATERATAAVPAAATPALPEAVTAAVTASAANSSTEAAAGRPEAHAESGFDVQPIATDAERRQTLEQRRNALPVFLKAADENITKLQDDIALARQRGAEAGELAALQARLDTLRRVREQVLERNADIRG